MWGKCVVVLAVWMVMDSIFLPPVVVCEVEEEERTLHRSARETIYSLDIMILVDRASFQAWYSRTQTTLSSDERRRQTFANIKTYFTLVMKEVTDLYHQLRGEFRFNFHPVGFYVDPEDRNRWLVMTINGQADAEQTLTKVRGWLRLNTNSSQYDHAIMFTGGDLATDNEGHTTARGTRGTVCREQSYNSVSVIEDRGSFQSVFSTAHELAHSLNAVHDGTSNNCSATDYYIMAPISVIVNDVRRRHPWFFSTCSGNDIARYVGGLTQTKVQSCLERSLPQDSDVPDVTGIMPGQLYDRDTQCRHLYGPQSAFCFNGNLSSICTWMPCRDPSKADRRTCNVHLAATGTTCGHKQWCQRGECVESANAPALASCVGDQSTIVNGMTCRRMAATLPALCYDVEVFTKCCYSCNNVHTGVEGCPFGDRKTGCGSEVCNKILSNGSIVDEDCCGTCRFNANAWTCQDVSSLDGKTCAAAVQRNGVQGCYNLTVAFHCCATCQRLRDLDRGKGCEYGDLLLRGCPTSSGSGGSRGQCDLQLCCDTCGNANDTSSAYRPFPHPSLLPPLLLLTVVFTIALGLCVE